jgi:hypothetical protein
MNVPPLLDIAKPQTRFWQRNISIYHLGCRSQTSIFCFLHLFLSLLNCFSKLFEIVPRKHIKSTIELFLKVIKILELFSLKLSKFVQI